MNMSNTENRKGFLGKIAKALVPLMLIVAGGAAFAYFKATAPTIERAAPERQATVVRVQPARTGNVRTAVTAMGTVVPAREVTLKARVSGEITSVVPEFIPGGHIGKGEELLHLDPSDHKLAVRKAESALEKARADLAIEEGNQTIAREELRILSELAAEDVAETALALRKPQLQQARAAVASAEADLRQARLNLERTVIQAPFNAMVIERHVNVGTYAGTQDSLATIVGTDAFWIEAVVPVDQLSRIDLNYPGGCPAMIRSQVGDGGGRPRSCASPAS